ncbi:cytosine permease [Nosocomiicoccus sp. HMSC067E10]|uniref:purine-cytosine permease family protein n=1 Tax=Nosocomiicoccus TaxID=489909 RepID=UPI00082BB411|nr:MULTISPECIES: cytosine permease [Nosocomiicoccus]OFL46345.1 cytosine permease [Nosocomiicoccus sp. HMSC067E10]
MEVSEIEKSNILEDYEIEPVPQEKRQSWVKLSLVWTAGIIALSATALGGALGSGMSLEQAIISAGIGAFILSILNAFSGFVGDKTGLSTAMVSTFALGRYGAFLVSLVIAVALFGWFGVQLDLFGSSLYAVINSVFGVEINKVWLVILGGFLMTVTSMIGYKALEKLSIFAVPLLAFLLIGSAFIILKSYNITELINAPLTGETITFGAGISIVIGSLAIGIIIAPDFSRYSKSSTDTLIASLLSYFVGYSIVLILAVFLAKATSQTDVVQIMISIGWGTGGMLVLILAQWTTNNTNLYSSSLAFSVVFKMIPKYIITIFAGTVGTVFAITGIYQNFIPFLSVLSIMIPPVGGIYVADFFMRHSKYHYSHIPHIIKFNYFSVIIWVVAILIALSTSPAPIGFDLFKLTTISALDAYLIALILQLIVSKFNLDVKGSRNL